MGATIIKNDSFNNTKDFNQFGFIPEFTATHINKKKLKKNLNIIS